MADNVNIIVQDTINDIVVNAAVIVETIDINVQAAVDEVQIIANPNNYVVNINRIIGEQVQSDWTQNDNQAPDYIKNKPSIPTLTSDLTNDGEDGINPFITAADVTSQVNSDWNATSGVAEILNKPTIPAEVTKTSDLTNDGADGINPFITAADIPPVTGFIPYTGATSNVDLGEYELKAGQVTLDTSPTGTAAVATTRWNNTIGSSETTLKGGSVILKNGVDLVARVVNKVTPNATLLRANYTAVRVSGAQGQRLAVAYAQANSDNNSADTIGVVCENIATNQEGFIMTVGQFLEINTTGSLQGETWADGDVLYLSPTTAGKLTNIKPTGSTGHIVVMGYVEYAHAIHGSIYVKIMNGWELDELHNVYISSVANNEGLFYDSATSLWKNKTIAAALGYTPVTNARTISTTSPLSGGGDLTANRTLSITQATTSTDGYLSSTDWNTFNNKQGELFDFQSKKGFIFWEDFLGDSLNSGVETWGVSTRITNGAGTITSNNTFPNRTYQQGVVAMSSNANAASQSVIRVGAFNNQAGTFFGNGKVIFETYVNVETLSTAADRFLVHIGYSASIGVNTNACYQFIYDEGGTSTNGGAASPNWKCCTFNNVTRVNTNTGIVVTASAWYKLRIEVNATNTGVDFYINNTLVATHTTGVGMSGLSPKIVFTKTTGLNNRNVYVDYIGMTQTFTNQR